jgi:hypothetical protein
MIAGARTPRAYVDPFGLVCLGLGRAPATTDLGRDAFQYNVANSNNSDNDDVRSFPPHLQVVDHHFF